jgi:hypothetical protein
MSTSTNNDTTGAMPAPLIAVVWLWVLIPFGYGVYNLVIKAQSLFG